MLCKLASRGIPFTFSQSRSIQVFSKGNGVYGALGQGNSLSDSQTFQEVPLLSYDAQQNAMVSNVPIKVSAGWGHSAVVTDLGKLFIFGRPYDFSNLMQLNRLSKVSKTLTKFVARSTNSAMFGNITGYFPSPSLVTNIGHVSDVHCSAGLTLALSDGDVYSFGLNKFNQCGFKWDGTSMHVFEPTKIPNIPKMKSIAIGLQHGLALSRDGEVFNWGKSHRGQLGTSTEEIGSLPLRVKFGASDRLATKICAGFGHSAAVTEDGALYVWGKGMSDKFKTSMAGTQVCENQVNPRRIELPAGRKAVNIFSSNFNVVVEASDRTIWAMGLGEIDRNNIATPIRVESDFHWENGDRIPQEILDTEGDDVIRNFAMLLPEGGSLRGSYQRVMIKCPNETRIRKRDDGSVATSTGMYDIIVHDGDAYLKELDVISQFNNNLTTCDVVDYCGGWQHSLIAVDASFRK